LGRGPGWGRGEGKRRFQIGRKEIIEKASKNVLAGLAESLGYVRGMLAGMSAP
jgi:hypothetical protein